MYPHHFNGRMIVLHYTIISSENFPMLVYYFSCFWKTFRLSVPYYYPTHSSLQPTIHFSQEHVQRRLQPSPSGARPRPEHCLLPGIAIHDGV